jgi:hypothetical protein
MKTKMRTKTLTVCIAMALGVALVLPVRLSAQTITTFDAPGSSWSIFAPSDNNNQLPVAISPIGNAMAGYFYDANFAAHGFVRSK